MAQKVKADIIAVGCVCVMAMFFLIIPYFLYSADEVVIITQNGTLYGQYPLNGDRSVIVKDEENGYNLVLISAGSVKVSDADCPDKLCVKQHAISRGGESIICLPHKLVVQIMSEEESDLDAVTN